MSAGPCGQRRWQQLCELRISHKDYMSKIFTIIILLTCFSINQVHAQKAKGLDTVSVQSGTLILKALLWRPAGKGPFPTIIFCHGSYGRAGIPFMILCGRLLYWATRFSQDMAIYTLVCFGEGLVYRQGKGEQYNANGQSVY